MTTNERVIGGHNWCLFQQQQLAAQVEERDATIEQLRADLADRDHDLVIFRRANDDHRTMYRDAVDDAVKLKRDLAERDATIVKLRDNVMSAAEEMKRAILTDESGEIRVRLEGEKGWPEATS